MGIDGETVETVADFIFLGVKSLLMVTAAVKLKEKKKACSLPLGTKAMAKLDSILKKRHYFADKGLSSQSYGFPVGMYGCESWFLKKTEC